MNEYERKTLGHIYIKEFRVMMPAEFSTSMLDGISSDDIADLMVWWDDATERGGWNTKPPTYLSGMPWALYRGWARVPPPTYVGDLFYEHVFDGHRNPMRKLPKEIDLARAHFKIWVQDAFKFIARFLQIERFELERASNMYRNFRVHYKSWWSIISPKTLDMFDGKTVDAHRQPDLPGDARLTTRVVRSDCLLSHFYNERRFHLLESPKRPK